MDLTDVITTVSAISAASIAAWGVLSASKSFKASQAPQIGMYLSSLDPENIADSQDFMFLNVENYGNQTARNLKVKFGIDFDRTLFYENKKELAPGQSPYKFRNTSLFKRGIKSIAPKQRHKFIIANMIDVNQKLEKGEEFPALKIFVTWDDGSKKYSDTIIVDFKDYLGQLNEISGASEINKRLKEIAEEIKKKTKI